MNASQIRHRQPYLDGIDSIRAIMNNELGAAREFIRDGMPVTSAQRLELLAADLRRIAAGLRAEAGSLKS